MHYRNNIKGSRRKDMIATDEARLLDEKSANEQEKSSAACTVLVAIDGRIRPMKIGTCMALQEAESLA